MKSHDKGNGSAKPGKSTADDSDKPSPAKLQPQKSVSSFCLSSLYFDTGITIPRARYGSRVL